VLENRQSPFPFVSIIIPCRNEENFIGATLENIIGQDYPKDKLEVFVIDGESTDGTNAITLQVATVNPFIHVLNNPEKVVPPALNMAIRRSKGDVIIRMDAHSIYPKDYISSLVKNLVELKADNVGGVWITEKGAGTLIADAIAVATSHPFGIGNAQYRLGGKNPMQVDTVPFGCYRKEVFEKIGLFDEDLIRNQDDEFNGRLIKSGGKIFLIPSIKIQYYARATLLKMSTMFYQYGLFKPLVNIKLKYPATLRQLVPPVLVLSILLLGVLSFFHSFLFSLFALEVIIYLMGVFLVSFFISIRKGLMIFLPLIVTFPIIHFSYGMGYLRGIIRFTILKNHRKKKCPIQRR